MSGQARRPLVAVSMGDPVGVGPEVVARAAREAFAADLVVFGDPRILAAVDPALPIRVVERAADARGGDGLAVIALSSLAPSWGRPSPESDRAQLEYVQRAVDAVLAGEADALATAPISKSAIHRAGAPWPGHTELLGARCGVEDPVMMLAGPHLRTVPVTAHVALAEVPKVLAPEAIRHAIAITADGLRRFFGCPRPRIAVAALNPHAGEGGLFGDEERRIIEPAMEAARAPWFELSGPHPPDTVFGQAASGRYDAVIGMYHDQALIPVKLLDFDHAVNVTLGLPMIRTSVDHGTAYDIAGQGRVSASSMIAAIERAASMALAARG